MIRKLIFVTLLSILLIFTYWVCFFPSSTYNVYDATITHITIKSKIQTSVDETITVIMTSGSLKGHIYSIDYPYDTAFASDIYTIGDHVFIGYNNQNGKEALYISEYDRRMYTFILILLFFTFIILIARTQGLMSLIGMFFSITVIMIFVIPHILNGQNPLLYAAIASVIIIPCTYYLSHGFKSKTTVAIIATFITLAFTTAIAYTFSHLLKIPSIASTDDTSGYYTNSGTLIAIQTFYLAGLLIGSLAVLNDITISQASIVTSLFKSNNQLSLSDLFFHAMEVGKDHIASLVNTLLLVYIGASFPFFLTFVKISNETGFDISNPLLSQEIIRTLSISIGIVAAVPIATYIASYFITRRY